MRSAWNVRVAGWISVGLAGATRAIIAASGRVVRNGAFARSMTMALAMRRDCRSSP